MFGSLRDSLGPAGLELRTIPDHHHALQELQQRPMDAWRAETEEGWCGVYYAAPGVCEVSEATALAAAAAGASPSSSDASLQSGTKKKKGGKKNMNR